MLHQLNRIPLAGIALSALFVAGNVEAYEWAGIEFHGFATVGATISDVDPTYLRGTTDKLSFDEDTTLGLQAIAPIGDHFIFQGQFLANGSRQPETGLEVELDWAFASYQFTEKFSLRGGKIRFPIALFSEVNEVGYTYPWVRTPQSVYGAVPFNAVIGADATFTTSIGDDLELTLQPYLGDFSEEIAFGADKLTLDLEDIVGINVSLGNDLFLVRAGVFDTEITIEATPFQDLGTTHYSVGAKLETERLIAYAEYFKTEFDDGKLVGFGDSRDGWYGTLGYRFGKFLPHVTIGERDSDSPGFTIGDTFEEITLGLRYEIGASAALKFEWTQSKPTNGTTGGLFDGPLLGESHGNIFSVAFDVVF